jgi:hypothetical protein
MKGFATWAIVLIALARFPMSALAQTPATTARPADATSASGVKASDAQRAALQRTDAVLVQQIAAQLGRHAIVQSAYTQTQTRAALRRPLISGGTLLFARDSGVVWTVDRPVHGVYVITDRGVRQIAEPVVEKPVDIAKDIDGVANTESDNTANSKVDNPVTSGKVERPPNAASAHVAGSVGDARGAQQVKAPPAAAAEVSRMMRAMLGGDLSALYSQFDVGAQGTVARWRLRLVPNQPQIASALRQVDLEGGDFVTSLEIVQTNGDILQWSFDGAHPLSTLPERERAWLSAK